jgi:cytidine deaminase
VKTVADLIALARAVQQHAYAPYSRFRVGCALEAEDGRVFTGCNVENASFGLTLCAERVALGRAVSEGETRLRRAVIVSDASEPAPPCGACRQAFAEFVPDMEIVCFAGKEQKSWQLENLLPVRFAFDPTSTDGAR